VGLGRKGRPDVEPDCHRPTRASARTAKGRA
jgi:hypothetical protein